MVPSASGGGLPPALRVNTIQSTRLIIAFLVVGTTLLTLPLGTAQFDTAGAENNAVIGATAAVNRVSMDSDGSGLLIIAAQTTTGSETTVALGNHDDGFTVVDLDIDAGLPATSPLAAKLNETTYLVLAATDITGPGFEAQLYLTEDSGGTWASIKTLVLFRAPTDGIFVYNLAVSETGAIYLIWEEDEDDVYFSASRNLGSSWTTAVELADNNGTPGQSGTEFCPAISSADIWSLDDTNFVFLYYCDSATTEDIWLLRSDDGGSFWTINGAAGTHVYDCGINGVCSQVDLGGNGDYAGASSKVTGTDQIIVYTETGGLDDFGFDGTLGSLSHTNNIDRNAAGNQILLHDKGTTPSIYLRDSDVAAWTIYNPTVLVSNSGKNGAVAITDTHAYYAYPNDNLGSTNNGRLEVLSFAAPIPDITGATSYWCSNPSITDFGGDPDADFGYNYVEQVDFFTDGGLAGDQVADVGSDLEDGYEFTSESDNAAYMGKGWGSPATYARTVFRIESDQEGRDSVFRAHMSFVENAVPSSTTKGDGLTTEAFTDYIAARFEENGNQWQITLTYNNNGQPSPLQYQGAINYNANPNNPRTFSLTVSTEGNGWARIQDETGETTILNVTNLAESGLPFLEALHGSAIMYSQWFVTTGSNTILNSYTFLDDNEDAGQNDDSTCIFFREGTLGQNVSVEGDQGTVPGSVVLDPPEPEPEGSSFLFDADNIDTQLFIGFLLVAGMVFIGVRQGVGQAAIGALFFVGLFLGYSLGWIPLWVILVIFTISLAAIFVLPRQSKDGV